MVCCSPMCGVNKCVKEELQEVFDGSKIPETMAPTDQQQPWHHSEETKHSVTPKTLQPAKMVKRKSTLMQRRNGMNLKLQYVVESAALLKSKSWGTSTSGSIKYFSTEAEMNRVALQENQARYSFFKHYQYKTSDILGRVSL